MYIYLLSLWNRERDNREFCYCFHCFYNEFQHSSTNILNICHVPVSLEIKETWSMLSRSLGSRKEYHITLSAIYISFDIDLSVFVTAHSSVFLGQGFIKSMAFCKRKNNIFLSCCYLEHSMTLP